MDVSDHNTYNKGFSTTLKFNFILWRSSSRLKLYLDQSLISRQTGRSFCTYIYIHFPYFVFFVCKIVYILSYREFCVEYKTIKKLSLSLLIVSTSQFYIYKGQIGIVFGTIVCICYLWVIGYRVRLRG